MNGILKKRDKLRSNKYNHNCELAFCMCKECQSEQECQSEKEFIISDKITKRKKFQSCFHGSQFNQCKSCQMICFLFIQKKNKTLKLLFKDLNKIIFSFLDEPKTKVYCCRCDSDYNILTADELDSIGYSSKAIMANNCDSKIKFSSRYYKYDKKSEEYSIMKNDDVLIVSRECSKYGEDGFSTTAGFFMNNKHLTIKQTINLYNVKENALVCDNCIGEMLKNGEIGDGGGVNEAIC